MIAYRQLENFQTGSYWHSIGKQTNRGQHQAYVTAHKTVKWDIEHHTEQTECIEANTLTMQGSPSWGEHLFNLGSMHWQRFLRGEKPHFLC